MNNQDLRKKHRPRSFSEFVGNKGLIKIIRNIIRSGLHPNGLLFYGPPGSGKTSLALVTAKGLNCLNFAEDVCGKCENCIAFDKLYSGGSSWWLTTIHDCTRIDEKVMEKIFYDLWNLPATKINRNIHIFDEFHRTKLPLQEQLLRPLDIRDDILLIFCLIELKVSKAFLQRVTVLKTIRPEIDELTPWLRRMCTLEGIVVNDSRALKQLALAADRLPRECLSLLQKISYLGEPLTIDLVNEITQDMQEIEDEESRYTLSEA